MSLTNKENVDRVMQGLPPEARAALNVMSQMQQRPPEDVLRDVCLPDGNGIELIDRMKNISPSAEIILLTAHGKIEDSVSAIKSSAFDYLVKGDDNNRIFSLIAKEMEKASEAFIVDITTEKQSHLKK